MTKKHSLTYVRSGECLAAFSENDTNQLRLYLLFDAPSLLNLQKNIMQLKPARQ